MSAITDISAFLAAELTTPFVYIPNSGNAGDALMACATYDIFDQIAVPYKSISHRAAKNRINIEGRVVVLAAGGNFNEAGYNAYAQLLARIHEHASKVILLPHTINGNQFLLSQLHDNTVLICREKISFEKARDIASRARVYAADDMALTLNVPSLLAYKPRYLKSIVRKFAVRLVDREASHRYPSLRNYAKGLFASRFWPNDKPSEKIAYLFRTDIESTETTLPPNNIDASETFSYGTTSSFKARYTVYHLLKFLDSLQVIHTNRLHIGIASALLGKEVHLYSNNYFKCKAVYEYSLKDRFKNVTWHDEAYI